jgi:hypothetical protein
MTPDYGLLALRKTADFGPPITSATEAI